MDELDSTIAHDALRFRALLNHPTLAFHILDSEGYTISINEAYTRLLGITMADWQERGYSVFSNPRFAESEQTPYLRRAWQGEFVALPPYQYTRATMPQLPTTEVWLRTYLFPVMNPDGSVREVIAFHEDITERYITQLELDHRVEFDRLLTGIIASFVNQPAESLDSMIDAALRDVGQFTGVDRAYVFLFSPTGATMANTHEWCAPDIPAFKPRFQSRSASALPWLVEQIRSGEPVQIPSPAALPETAALERMAMAEQGVQSLLLVPLVRVGKVIGFIGFDAVRHERVWPTWSVAMMQMLSETLVQALERKNVEEALSERERQYRSVFNTTSDALIIVDPAQNLIVAANPAAGELLRQPHDRVLGQPLEAFLPLEWHEPWNDIVVAVSAGEQRQLALLKVPHLKRVVDLTVTQLVYGGLPHVLLIVRDVTEQADLYERLERRVAERTHEISTLLTTVRHIGSTLELEPLLTLIVEQIHHVVEYDAAAVFWLMGNNELHLLHYIGPIPQDTLLRIWDLDQAGYAEAVVRTGQPMIIADVRADTPEAAIFRNAAQLHLNGVPDYIVSWMGVPLLVRDRAVGLLTFDHGTPGFYTEYHADLAFAFAQQAAVAIENARLFEQSNHLATMMERQRLARELHDSVSQALYGIALGARTASTLLERDPARAVEPVSYVLTLAEAALSEMRALIFELRPESLESEGLVAALTKRTDTLRTRHQLHVETELIHEPNLSIEGKEVLYRVAQEALHNVVKHSRAENVWITLRETPESVELLIRDDGCGFDPQEEYPGHLGLQSMRERVQLQQGRLAIESAPGAGTILWASMPRPM